MKIGFIGLGKMGTAMVGCLIDGGHEVGVYNRTASKAESLVARGAKLMESVGQAARCGTVVITMVENDDALSAVTYGDGGLLSSMDKGSIHVAMGTHSIALIKAFTQDFAKHSVNLVAAPVLGRPPAAEAGQLGIIAGGASTAIDICQPLFDIMGRRTYPAGPEPTAAAVAKIINNFLLAASISALGEAFVLGEKSGLPAQSLYEILTDGLFSGPAHKIYGQIIADKNYFDQPGFAATTGLKDVKLALAAGEAFAVPLPSANLCRDRLLSAIANGHAGADWSVMAHEQARASGVS